MNDDVAYYLRKAAELKRMAERAQTEGHRLSYLRLVQSWKLLADEPAPRRYNGLNGGRGFGD
jgi:hypothetical protein